MTDNQLNQFPPPPSSPVGGNPERMAMASPSTVSAAPQRAMPAIEIKGVSKFYGSQIGLVNANLTLPSGGIVGLMGPNGCGKTTLMKILAGVMQDYEGEVRLFGKTPGAETKAFTSYLPDSSLLADNGNPPIPGFLHRFRFRESLRNGRFFPPSGRSKAICHVQRHARKATSSPDNVAKCARLSAG